VRLAATEGVGTAWLPGVMQMFRASHPDVLVDLGIGFRSYNLAQREADIALRWMSPGEQNSLIGRKVATVTFGVVRVLPNVSQQEDLFLVAHEDLRRSTRIRAVFDFLVDAFSKDASFFLNGGQSVFEGAALQCGLSAGNPDHEHGLAPREELTAAE